MFVETIKLWNQNIGYLKIGENTSELFVNIIFF